MHDIRVYGRYSIFSSACQHCSFGTWVSFHHEALRYTLTDPDWFGPLHTFILHLTKKCKTKNTAVTSLTTP